MRILYARDGHTEAAETLPDRAEAVWVDLGRGEDGRLEEVVRSLYPAHPAAIERVLDGRRHHPSLLIEERAVTAVLAHPEGNAVDLKGKPVGLVIGDGFLVTTHLWGDNRVLDEVYETAERKNGLKHGLSLVLYHYLARHISRLEAIVEEISQGYERIHHIMLKHPIRNLAHEILELRRETAAVDRMARPEGDVFQLIGSRDFPYIADDDRLYFKDLADRMQGVLDDLEGYREGLSGAVEAFSSMQSNEINKVMRVLTLISVLALPATTIASIYGMNFQIPELHWNYGYFYSLVLMTLVTIALLLYMRRVSPQGR